MNTDGYFWYSEKMKACISRMDSRHHVNYCEINGEVKEYTNWTRENKDNTEWDDVIFLGHGNYHHSVPVAPNQE